MSKKFISGLFFGALAGASAALLLAPKKGEELREELSDKSENLKAVALDYIELLSVKGEQLVNTTIQTTQSFVDKFQQGNIQENNDEIVTISVNSEDKLKNEVVEVKNDTIEDVEELLEETEK